MSVADPGESGPPPWFLDRTEAQKAPKKSFGDLPSLPFIILFQGLDDCTVHVCEYVDKEWVLDYIHVV